MGVAPFWCSCFLEPFSNEFFLHNCAFVSQLNPFQDRELYQTKQESKEKCSKKLSLFEDQRPEYLLELAHGYVKKGQKPKWVGKNIDYIYIVHNHIVLSMLYVAQNQYLSMSDNNAHDIIHFAIEGSLSWDGCRWWLHVPHGPRYIKYLIYVLFSWYNIAMAIIKGSLSRNGCRWWIHVPHGPRYVLLSLRHMALPQIQVAFYKYTNTQSHPNKGN